ncbi:MAG: DUF6077 domain-containing protein [Thomasclavelia sp.]|nr:DUF6077 domain-containing protein [Thomasclavelia sp.]
MQYLVGVLFIILFISYLYTLGSAISIHHESFAHRFIVGYVIYSFFVAIGGIPMRLLNASWMTFVYYMIFLIILLFIISIRLIKKYKVQLFPEGPLMILKNHWFVLLVATVCILVSLTGLSYILGSNCGDDGYYLSAIGSFPYRANPFWTTPSTGLSAQKFIFNSYMLNTFEMEAAFFSSVLKIDPVIYCRLFLAWFNYFLYGISIIAIAEKIFVEKLHNPHMLQYVTFIIVLFGFGESFLVEHNIFNVYDIWQYQTAMYYGSTLVRTSGVFMLMLPLFDNERIRFKDFIFYGLISVTLLSKSTVVVPLSIVVFGYGFCIKLLLQEKRDKIIGGMLLIAFIIVQMVFPENSLFQELTIKTLSSNLHQPLLLWAMIVIAIVTIVAFFKKNHSVILLNGIMLCLVTTILINPLNNMFESLSFYQFVEQRAATGFIYAIIVISIFEIVYLIYKYIKKEKIIIRLCLSCFAIFLLLFVGVNNGSITSAFSYYQDNPNITPQSTIELAKSLTQLKVKENKTINALIPDSVTIGNYSHSLTLLIRTYAPDINVPSSIARFGTQQGSVFSNYSGTDCQNYLNFIKTPVNRQNTKTFSTQLNDYPINCIVSTANDKTTILAKLGFDLVDTIDIPTDDVHNYYVYYNSTVDPDVKVPEDYGKNTDDGWENNQDDSTKTDSPTSGLYDSGSYKSNGTKYYYEKYYSYAEASKKNKELKAGGEYTTLGISKSTDNNGNTVYVITWYETPTNTPEEPETQEPSTPTSGLADSGTYIEGSNTVTYQSYYSKSEADALYATKVSDTSLTVNSVTTRTYNGATVYVVSWYTTPVTPATNSPLGE